LTEVPGSNKFAQTLNMKCKFLTFSLTAIATMLLKVAVAQDEPPSSDLYSLSLEDLTKIPVTVATQKATSLNETPGSITVITEDMIKNSGARDLNDLLVMIPGFDLASDYGNIVSFGIRGNWALEGKMLVLIDGQIINETNYGSAPLGQRFPLNQIKKIEVIRGSGSVIYGGVAALAVISITTKSGSDLEGLSVASTTGLSQDKLSRQISELSFGKSFGNGIKFSVHSALNFGNNSNRVYNSPSGEVLDYRDKSGIRSRSANVKFAYKDFNLIYIKEDYRIERTVGNPAEKYTFFNGHYLGANYNLKVNKFTIVPSVSWKKHEPWNVIGGPQEALAVNSYRTQGSLKLLYAINDKLDFMAGSEYYNILSKYRSPDPAVVYYNGSKSLALNNIAFFAEGIYRSRLVNITGGIRYDNHSTAGSAFVPRLALTKAFDKIHFKATYSQAFKTPLAYNININKDIKPERVQMIEFETGYKILSNAMFTVNLYDIKVDKSILYSYDDATGTEHYDNVGASGTRGIESELRTTGKFGYVTINHSLYKPAYTEVSNFIADDNTKSFMGLPTNKITVAAGFPVTKKISVNPSMIFLSKRSTYIYDINLENYVVHSEKNFKGVNCTINWKDFLAKRLTVGLSVYDALNQKLNYVSAYYTGLNPQPAQPREFLVTLRYDFKSVK
jgi:outer membrane cobalamin receptor